MIVTKMAYYKHGTIRVFGVSPSSLPTLDFGGRGKIKKLSRKSLERMALFASETELKFKTMITLTYPREYGLNGKRVKSDLNKYLVKLRRYCPMVGYFWFLEFQRRGAPHYHIMVDCEVGHIYRAFLALDWAAIVGKDMDNVFYVHNRQDACGKIRKEDGAKRYVLKYCSKIEQKTVPERYQDVGRFWGFNKKVKDSIPEPSYIDIDEDGLRTFLRAIDNPTASMEHLPSVIFHRENVSRETFNTVKEQG